jgi:uncharacterized protein (TIGR01244 family)
MPSFRAVTPLFSVSEQIESQDLQAAARAGVVLIINNRPDAEAPGQPAGSDLEAAARSLGLHYTHLPIRGGPTREQIVETQHALDQANGPVLAFCRSGTRSIVTWAIAQAERGAMTPDELKRLGEAAGYDLGPVFE